MTDAPASSDANPEIQPPMVRVLGQYTKDLSFENPGAPDTLRSSSGQPDIEMSIDVRVQNLDQETYEVSLHLSANAKREDKPIFIAELVYAGLFQIRNLDDRSRDPFLMIECPRIIFPFARRILADATRDGGFPPLMLEPVDFAALYRQRLARQQGGEGQPGAAGGDPPSGTA